MKMQKIILASTLFLINSLSGYSQNAISGPTCVIPGTEYHYSIISSSSAFSGMQVCVTGGRIKDVQDSCISQMSSPIVKIIWNNINQGSITLSLNGNSRSFQVKITSELDSGKINAASLNQLIEQGSIPGILNCTEAKKGNCTPLYFYQWQRSLDKVKWEDMLNANNKNLVFTNGVNEPTYYRRKVTETNSGTIKYSETASVYVTPKPN